MKKNKKSDYAVAGIVTALLIVGLIVVVFSMIQTVYVPQWMKQKESEHMDQVADQIAQLKFALDIHTSTEQITPISTSITLGNKEMSFLKSSRAFGSLTISIDECNISIDNGTIFSYSLGVIKYSSENAYYLDQTYIYEAGAVILEQIRGNIMFIKPSLSIDNDNEVNITFTIVDIISIGGKNSANGYGIYPIQTEFSNSTSIMINNTDTIEIETNYKNAWNVSINSSLVNADLNHSIDYSISDTTDGIIIDFNAITVNVNLKLVNIATQIGHGWIE